MAETQSRPAISERGEIMMVLDGQEFGLRPSFEAIGAFEEATGKGLVDLSRSALEGRMTTAEASVIATECIRAWGRSTENRAAAGVNAQRVGELMTEMDGGFHAGIAILSMALTLAATGGVTASGEVKAATGTKT